MIRVLINSPWQWSFRTHWHTPNIPCFLYEHTQQQQEGNIWNNKYCNTSRHIVINWSMCSFCKSCPFLVVRGLDSVLTTVLLFFVSSKIPLFKLLTKTLCTHCTENPKYLTIKHLQLKMIPEANINLFCKTKKVVSFLKIINYNN